MKKLAIVFIAAVLVPSVVLACLAMRSIRDQEIVVQSQLALLHQARTDSLAADLRVAMDDVRSYFGTLVDDLATEHKPDFLCTQFDSIVRSEWGQVLTGCVVTEGGEWVAPQARFSRAASAGILAGESPVPDQQDRGRSLSAADARGQCDPPRADGRSGCGSAAAAIDSAGRDGIEGARDRWFPGRQRIRPGSELWNWRVRYR